MPPRDRSDNTPRTVITGPTGTEASPFPVSFERDNEKAPKTKRGERTRQKVLDASRVVFARDGYTGARIADITTEAGVAFGTFYGYFDDKTNVFRALIEPVLRDLYAAARSPYLDASEPEIVLRGSLRQYMVVYYENRDVMRTLTEAISVDEEFRDMHFRVRSGFVRRIARNLVRVGTERPLDPILEASALGGMVENFCWVWFSMGGERDAGGGPILDEVGFDEMADVLTRLFLAGVFHAGADPVPEMEAD